MDYSHFIEQANHNPGMRMGTAHLILYRIRYRLASELLEVLESGDGERISALADAITIVSSAISCSILSFLERMALN